MTNTPETLNILNPDFRMPEHCGGDRWSILHGDSLQILRQFVPNSFDAIITDTEATLRRVMNIPDNYKVGFFQGGATQQFAMVPLNFMTTGKADYLVTGNFSNLAAKEAAKALGIECITLNASELASQLAEETAAPADLRFPALLAAADRLGIQYIATGHHARVETDADGVSHLLPAADAASDESAALAALPQETLARLILPLGDFSPEDAAEIAAE